MPFSRKLSSLHRLAIVEQALGAGVIEIPMDGSEWTLTRGARAVLGMAGDGQAGASRAIADLIHPADRPSFFKALSLMQAEAVPPSLIYRICPADGRVRYIALRFEVLVGDTGRAQRFVGVLRDVTEQEIADRAQGQIGRLLDTLMSGLQVDVVWRTDAAGQLLDHFARGNLARTVTPTAHQWHGFITCDNVRQVQEKMAGGAPYAIAIDVLCEDGVVRRCLSRGVPLKDESGRVVEWCGVICEAGPDRPILPREQPDPAEAAEHMTGAAVRAACGALDWTHEDLARRSGLSLITVRRMASSGERLLGLFRRASVEAAVHAFVAAGLGLRVSNERKMIISF